MSFPLQLKAYVEPVDARLRQLLPSVDTPPSELHSAMRYSCLAPGKRLRPALCLSTTGALGFDPLSTLDAACAVEMVHCFSLIHDDLPAIDNDDLRRGVPTLHVKFGEAMAILAGDALFALAFQTLSSSPHPAERVVQATKLLTTASGSGGLVGGEVADVLSEGKAADAQTLEFIHSRKTGALIAAACEIGPTLAGAEDMQIDGCRTFGAKIGLAFQIADDILNETSSAEQLGKAAGSDRQREKATFPSLYGVDESQKMAESAVEEAIFALRTVGIESPGLEALARYAVERIH